jgi:hypothetical protein
MLYALGNKKFKKDYLSLTLVITAFASFFLTVLLVNSIDGLGDWILSIFIGAVLTILALVFTRSDDVLENNIRFQE